MKAIIVDIDGTLANISHRRQHVESKPKNWKAFFENMHLDKVNLWCREIILKFYKDFYFLALVSGRSEDHRKITEEWLKLNSIPYSALYMRKSGDFRDDSIVKKEIYESEIKNKLNILFVLDDRKRVTEMWRREGLVVLQCDEGNY